MEIEETPEPLDTLVDEIVLERENELLPDGKIVLEEPAYEVIGTDVAVNDGALLEVPDSKSAEEIMEELLILKREAVE